MIKDKIPSPMEIMQMLMKFSEQMNQRFDDVFVYMNQRFDKIDERFNYHQTWLERIESKMATKDKLNSLLIILEDKKVINSFEVTHIKQTDLI